MMTPLPLFSGNSDRSGRSHRYEQQLLSSCRSAIDIIIETLIRKRFYTYL